jgi:hypothetical protein
VTFGTDSGEAEDEEATGGGGLLAFVLFAGMRVYYLYCVIGSGQTVVVGILVGCLSGVSCSGL